MKLCIPKIFGLIIAIIGIADLTQPESFKLAMDQINMPHYILWILGVAKISGGMVLFFFRKPSLVLEWAYSGFFIWSIGGIAAHFLSGHGIIHILPIFGLTILLIISYAIHQSSVSKN